jgi:hypothetical protein
LSSPCYLHDYVGGHSSKANGGITISMPNNVYGVRPVISLKSTDVVESGDGTQNNPYVISTN